MMILKLSLLLLLAMLILLKSIYIQVVHRWAAHQCQTLLSSRITIEGLAPNFGMPQQAMTSMYGQGYTYTAPTFTIPNPSSTTYTFRFNSRAYPKPSGNFQAPYTTVAYTDPIPLPDSLLCFLPRHAYQTPPRFNAYDQPIAGGFGYETPRQFPLRPQPIEMKLTRATAELGADPNNLINQLITILRESFDIEPKG
jgi:hypothetical protein